MKFRANIWPSARANRKLKGFVVKGKLGLCEILLPCLLNYIRLFVTFQQKLLSLFRNKTNSPFMNEFKYEVSQHVLCSFIGPVFSEDQRNVNRNVEPTCEYKQLIQFYIHRYIEGSIQVKYGTSAMEICYVGFYCDHTFRKYVVRILLLLYNKSISFSFYTNVYNRLFFFKHCKVKKQIILVCLLCGCKLTINMKIIN